MSEAFKCDRCGAFETGKHPSCLVRYGKVYDREDRSGGAPTEYELCSQCTASFAVWADPKSDLTLEAYAASVGKSFVRKPR